MKLSGHEDLRVQKTIQSIRTAFSVMLLKEDYRKITVTALCRQAVINKKTFYRYYDSVDALLEEILSEFSKGYVDILADYRLPEDLDKINAAFFHYAVHQGPLYEKILCSVSYQHLSSHLVEEYIAKSWGTAPAFQQLSPVNRNCLRRSSMLRDCRCIVNGSKAGKRFPLKKSLRLPINC